MLLIGSQIVVLLILVGVGIYTYRTYSFKLSVMHITICALMIAISTVLQLFSLTIPLFGFPSLKVGFAQLPIMVLGILMNPAYAFFVGVIKDIVGLMVAPSGAPYLGFTLNTVLVGVIPALCYHKLRKTDAALLKMVVGLAMSMLLSLSALFVIRPDWIGLDAALFTVGVKALLVLVLIIIGAFLMRMVVKGEDSLFLIYMLSVFLVEVIVNFTSTPIYLNIMYGIPIPISVMVRVFKAGFMYPITVMVGYFVIKVMFRIQRNYEETE